MSSGAMHTVAAVRDAGGEGVGAGNGPPQTHEGATAVDWDATESPPVELPSRRWYLQAAGSEPNGGE